jgi:hypothetical protein
MNSHMTQIRWYRILSSLAVIHSAVVLIMFTRLGSGSPFWLEQLWVGFATLLFLWPIVLVLHSGRSALCLIVAVVIGSALFVPCADSYSFIAAMRFGLPPFVRLTPISVFHYVTAYRAGRAEAQKDIKSGHLVIEENGLGAGYYADILKQRCQAEMRIGGCASNERIEGHAKGYNEVSEAEIERRFGKGVLAAIKEEAMKRLQQNAIQ